MDLDAPVTHISYYEADAYARWAGRVLPTELEWELAARRRRPRRMPSAPSGNGRAAPTWPIRASGHSRGALGEYNGKFMANQFVLRGSSVRDVRGPCPRQYRNFFYPHQRWQFTGLRLADAA